MAQQKMGLSLPVMGAEYTYETRDTGGGWATAKVMEGGANNVYRGFTSPVCDELRITATTATSTAIDRIHLAGLSILTGLVFDSSSGLTAEAQPTNTRPATTAHVTFRVTEETATTHVITITGIGQEQLDIRQIFFAKLTWLPDYNYSYASSFKVGNSFLSQQVIGSYYQHYSSGGRSQSLGLSNQSETAMLDLAYFINHQTVNGFCLFERDTVVTPLVRQDYVFAVFAQMGQISHNTFQYYSTELTITEAFEE